MSRARARIYARANIYSRPSDERPSCLRVRSKGPASRVRRGPKSRASTGATTYNGRENLNNNSGTTIDEPLLHQNHYDSKWNYIGTPSSYEKRKIFDINSGTTINGPRYGNQWRRVLGAFTTNGAASTISQSMNQGATYVLEPTFHAAHPETDGLPYQSANDMQQNNKNQRRNGFLQYGSGDGGKNLSEASECKQRLPFEWVNNDRGHRMNRLYP